MLHFEKLKVWERARQLSQLIYAIIATFPSSERSNLTSQMRRATTSIVSNICESTGRRGIPDQIRILQIAMGSARELHGQIISAGDVGLISEPDLERSLELVREVQRMLAGLIRYKQAVAERLKKKPPEPGKEESDKE